MRARVEIDLGALRANVRALRARTDGAAYMAVVKADAYGHGMVRCAEAALQAGAGWVGVATPYEALELRAAGITPSGPASCAGSGRPADPGARGSRPTSTCR